MNFSRAFPTQDRLVSHRRWLAVFLPAVVATGAHLYVRALPPSESTPLVLLDHLFNLGLAALVLLACWALGLSLLRLLGCDPEDALPRGIMAMALGLGVLSLGAFALGMLGIFRPEFLILLVGVLAIAALPDSAALLSSLKEGARRGRAGFAGSSGSDRILLLIAAGVLAAALPVALAPLTDYDGWVYHVAGPALFLSAGRFYPVREIDGANFPFNAEMIHGVGLAFGSESFGRLVNVALWGLLALGTYWMGRRYLARRTGFFGALLFLTVPSAYLASSTSVEVLWALFTMAAVLALAQYLDRGGERWIVLMGILSGLTLGTKLLALGLPLALGSCLGLHLLFVRRAGPVTTARALAILGATTLVVGSPWYLKNWLFLGNPLYPLFADGTASYLFRVNDVGNPKSLVGYLTLPLSIFFPPSEWTFAAALPSHNFLSYLFLALPLVLLVRRNSHANYWLLFVAVFFAFWAAGYQLVRFLYPMYPLVGLLVAHALLEARLHRWSLWPRWLGPVLMVFLLFSFSLEVSRLNFLRPFGVLAGVESPDGYLARAVWTHSGVRWANDHLPAGSRLYLVGTGQTYHLRHQARPDQGANNLTGLFAAEETGARAVESLRSAGFTHVFLSDGDLGWLFRARDPEGTLRRQSTLLKELLDAEASRLYYDRVITIYGLDVASR